MSGIATFDHSGFVVEDIPRSHKFYRGIFGAKALHTANLNVRTYSGWPIISFIELGAHRFEVCLAQHALAAPDERHPFPLLGFAVANETSDSLIAKLDGFGVAHTPLIEFPESTGLLPAVRVSDPDGNPVDLVATPGAVYEGDEIGKDQIATTDMCHVALEATDLDEAERFYTEVLGLVVLGRDEGDLGDGRLILKNNTGQVLTLEKVAELGARSRYCGPDPLTAPPFEGSTPYAGAHMAVIVDSQEDYDEVEGNLRAWKVYTDGDIRAGERANGERSEYFYDPTGNRLQLIVFSDE